MLRIFYLITIFTLFGSARAQEDAVKAAGVPWDTLAAEIQIARALAVPDSIKDRVIQDQFAARGVTPEQYRRFYSSFFRQSLKQQRRFIEQVKSILQERINKSRKKGISGNSGKRGKPNLPPESKLIK